MVIYENECVHCDNCVGCGADKVAHYVCDKCELEDDLYIYDGKQLCFDCIADSLTPVEEGE